MSSQISHVAIMISLILIASNVSLAMFGYIDPATSPIITRTISQININPNDADSNAFQASLLLKDSNSQAISFEGTSFMVSVLDFIEDIPIVGPIVSIFRLLYEMLYFGAFGVVQILGRAGMPSQFLIVIGSVMFVIYMIAMYGLAKDFMASRGGSK